MRTSLISIWHPNPTNKNHCRFVKKHFDVLDYSECLIGTYVKNKFVIYIKKKHLDYTTINRLVVLPCFRYSAFFHILVFNLASAKFCFRNRKTDEFVVSFGLSVIWLSVFNFGQIYLIEHWSGWVRRRKLRIIFRKLLRNVALYLPVSTRLVFKDINHVLIPNIIDDLFINIPIAEREETHATKRLIFVGRLEPVKNIEKIIYQFSTIPSAYDELVVVGDGTLLKNLKEHYQHNTKIKFTGALFGNSVREAMDQCGTLVLHSRTENQPQVVIEALFRGLLVNVKEYESIQYLKQQLPFSDVLDTRSFREFLESPKQVNFTLDDLNQNHIALKNIYSKEAVREFFKSIGLRVR